MSIANVWSPRLGALLALIGGLGACTRSSTDPGAVVAISLNVVSGNTQSGPVNLRLPTALRVQVLDINHQPVPNFLLNFVVTSGGGSVFGGAELTDAQGYAEERWTLGPRLGPQTVEAREVNPYSGVAASYGDFTAIGTPPNNVLVVALTGPTGLAVMNADGSGLDAIGIGGMRASAATLSPDHSRLLVLAAATGTSATSLYLVNVKGAAPSLIAGGGASAPAWSPDGVDYLWVLQNSSGATVSGTDVVSPAASFCNGTQWSYSADGTKLLDAELGSPKCTTTNDFPLVPSGVYLTSLDTTAKTFLLANASDPAWSPDGQHIAVTYNGKTTVMDPDGDNIKATSGSFGLVSWSPDSQLWAVDSGYVNSDGTNYMKVTGCPCKFAWR